MKYLLLFIALGSLSFADELETDNTFTNTNFVQNAQGTLNEVDFNLLFDYNRLRWSNKMYLGDFSSQISIDNDTLSGSNYLDTSLSQAALSYSTDIPFQTSYTLSDNPYSRMKIYRAFVKYEGEKHAVKLGLQRVAFGVGRVWTPTDMFNPLKSISLESSQRPPVLAGYYSYAFSDTGSAEFVVSVKEDNSSKEAIRIKEYLLFADIGIILVKEKNRELIGYEIAGHLFDTGLEFRSEGGLFTNTVDNVSFIKAVVGLDYGFENSTTLTFEYLYNQTDYSETIDQGQTIPSFGTDSFTDVISQRGGHYLAAITSYTFTPLLSSFVLVIQNLEDGSGIIVPTLSYSLSDESSMQIGGFVGYGNDSSEYGSLPLLSFISYSITF